MRIRTKIALVYTQLTFIVLLGSFVFVYLITSKRLESQFYDSLWDRAMITAQVMFEKDEMTGPAYSNLLDKSRFVLNSEKIYVYNSADPYVADSLLKIVPFKRDANNLLAGKTIEFKKKQTYYIGVYYPDNEGNFIVIASAIDTVGTASRNSLFDLLVIILISSTVLVYFIGHFYAKKVLSPIMVIINNVKRITANNLKRILKEEHGNDELSELSRTFNNMIVRLRDSFDMQYSFIRNASHELRNPLTAILGETEIALDKPHTEAEYVATLEAILVETERLNVMLKDLFVLAQTDFDFSRIPKERFDMIDLLRDVSKNIPEAHIEVIPEDSGGFMINGVYSLLRIAFFNVISNASKFSSGKPVTITAQRTPDKIVVEVKDSGIGIPQQELKHVLQPFYRAKNSSLYEGTGIGLALALRIVSLHGGKINIKSESGEGTVVSVIFDDISNL